MSNKKEVIFIGNLIVTSEPIINDLITLLIPNKEVKLIYSEPEQFTQNPKLPFVHAHGANSMIFYFGQFCSYETICMAMFYLGLGKKMAIIWDQFTNTTIDIRNVKQNEKVLCINEHDLKSYVIGEAKHFQVPIYYSMDDFIAKHFVGEIFDLQKYREHINQRIVDEDYQEGLYGIKTKDLESESSQLSSVSSLTDKKEKRLKKLGKTLDTRHHMAQTYIRKPRDSSAKEYIFRRFMHVNRSIEKELTTTKPHRLNPTLFIDVPYRQISGKDIPESKVIDVTTGKYKSIHVNVCMLMSYQWGLILHYLAGSKEDRQAVIKKLEYSSSQNNMNLISSFELPKFVDQNTTAVTGGYKENIDKMIKLYHQYKEFSRNKLEFLDQELFEQLLQNPNLPNTTNSLRQYGRDYTKQQIALDFIQYVKQECEAHKISLVTEQDQNKFKEFFMYYIESINNSREFLKEIIDFYPTGFEYSQYKDTNTIFGFK